MSGSQRCLDAVSWGVSSGILNLCRGLEQDDAAGRRGMRRRMCRMWEAASHKVCHLAGVIPFTLGILPFDGMQSRTCDELDSYGREGKLPIFGCSFRDL